jgi:DNA-binding NtrC family response regulator
MASRILIVDDDPQILKLFSKILTKGGYTVITENSGSRAMEALEKAGPVDLMVLDLSMPERDGFEVLKEMRIKRPGLRILVTSGFLGGALLKASELLGATASLSKTEAPKRLLETVNDLLRR